MRTNPVNPFELDGQTYLFSPRGTTQWVRNMRVAREGELRSGRKVRHFTAEEVPDSEKLPLMRLYMDKWSWEVKGFLGIDAKASDEEIGGSCRTTRRSCSPSTTDQTVAAALDRDV